MDNLFRYTLGDDGIAMITIDQKDNPANLFSFEFIDAYLEVAGGAVADDRVRGVIVTSARRIFMAGADLRELAALDANSEFIFNKIMETHRRYRAIETGGKPFVAAINGTALGGGMELCLTCHHRIVLDQPDIKLGFPEVRVGLLPGGGGTAKLPYLLGLQNGLTYLLQGTQARPPKALKDGLVDEVAATHEEMLAAARKWITENPNPVQPWDDPHYHLPGGGLMTPSGAQIMMAAIARVRQQTRGNYPNVQYILSTVHDGLQVSIDRALETEARYFTKALRTKEAKNMIRTGFLEMQAAQKGKARPKGIAKYEVKKLGIIGAGMMGGGIACVSARAGMEVVLTDITPEKAAAGKSYSEKVLDKALAKGRTTPEKVSALMARIHPAVGVGAMKGCDLVVEAVFEDLDLKHRVLKETESVLDAGKIIASNTSTLPITQLASVLDRPENFIGLHFFSPVEKMPLVEIIVGRQTADRTIAAAVDYVMALRKIPIVVNDSRGFYTSRTFGTYTSEGLFLLEEGVPPTLIENMAKAKGMPVGPLAVLDEVSLTLSLHIHQSTPQADRSPAFERSFRLTRMLVEEYGRAGKKTGKGLYDYPSQAGGQKRLWPGLSDIFKHNLPAIDPFTVGQRLMHRQALEAFRCLEEGVLCSAADGNIGSVMGWGFPIYTGGALSYIDFVGIRRFVDDCDELAERFGPRFRVSGVLRELARKGRRVSDFRPPL